MTENEHRLMVTMFGIHFGMMAELINTLRSNGALHPGDLASLWRHSFEKLPDLQMHAQALHMYETLAAGFGVSTGLPPS